MIQLVSQLQQKQQGVTNEETLGLIFRRAGINSFDKTQMGEITKSLERVPIVQMRWSIVKVNEFNEPLEGQALEEGGEAQVVIDLKRVNNANS